MLTAIKRLVEPWCFTLDANVNCRPIAPIVCFGSPTWQSLFLKHAQELNRRGTYCVGTSDSLILIVLSLHLAKFVTYIFTALIPNASFRRRLNSSSSWWCLAHWHERVIQASQFGICRSCICIWCAQTHRRRFSCRAQRHRASTLCEFTVMLWVGCIHVFNRVRPGTVCFVGPGDL